MTDESATEIRLGKFSDLIWIEPIAKEYGEWELILTNMDSCFASFVIEGKALVYFYADPHYGTVVAGCTNRDGMREFIRLMKYAKTLVDEYKPPHVYLCFDETNIGWQEKLAVKMGCVKEGGGMYKYTPPAT